MESAGVSINKSKPTFKTERGLDKYLLRWIPGILHDLPFCGLILSFGIIAAFAYAGLHAMIYVGGVAYRWAYIAAFVAFGIYLALWLTKYNLKRDELRSYFLTTASVDAT